MRARWTTLLCLIAAIAIASVDGAFAQKLFSLMPDEVVIELSNSVSEQQVDALQRRFRLTRIASQTFQLSNSRILSLADPRQSLGCQHSARIAGQPARGVGETELSIRASREGRRGWPGQARP